MNFGSVGFVDARAQLFKHLTQTPHDRNENTRTHSNSEMLEHVKTETGNDFKITKKIETGPKIDASLTRATYDRHNGWTDTGAGRTH